MPRRKHEGIVPAIVNTICWNETGDLLLSGSDDHLLNIHDVWQEKIIHSIVSGHHANILSAAFLPCSGDTKTVSCSSDGMVRENEINSQDTSDGFCCHIGAVYQVLVVSGEASTFFSCGEDSIVRQYDTRQKNSCSCPNGRCQVDVVIRNSKAVSCMSVNPVMSHHLAIGSSDGYIKIYDRRMFLSKSSLKNNNQTIPICSFIPPDISGKELARITSLKFNSRGNEILASYRGDGLYLYSLDPSNSVDNEDNKHLLSNTRNVETEPEPGIKRLRLRVDWSDTGPDSRPIAELPRVLQRSNEVIMNRVTNYFTNWFDETFHLNVPNDDEVSQRNDDANTSEEVPDSPLIDDALTGNEPYEDVAEGIERLIAQPFQYDDFDTLRNEAASRIQRFFRNRMKSKLNQEDVENIKEEIYPMHPKLIMNFQGHRNSRTMIQEANFWGDSFIISGSDCGHVFIWEKETGKLVSLLLADKHVVNRLQPHPYIQVLATSGIDKDVKIWAPTSQDPINLDNADEVIRRNKAILSENRNTFAIPTSFAVRMILSTVGRNQAARRQRALQEQQAGGSSNDTS